MNSKTEPLSSECDNEVNTNKNVTNEEQAKRHKKQVVINKWNKRLAKIANKLALSLMVNYK